MFSGYFVWWYGTGMNQAYTVATAFLSHIVDSFSLPTLTRTLFAPWKNDVLVARNVSLSDQIKIWQLNLASRIAGFLIRIVVLAAALLILLTLLLTAGLVLALWLIVPLLVLILPILGVARLFT